MRIVFCGTPASAVPSLEALADHPGWEIAAVLTQPDRPAGRGRQPTPSPVKEAAVARGLTVHAPEKLKEMRPALTDLAPDVVAVVAYGHIFRRWLLELPRLGCVNVHFSLLPRHRGVAPVTWAILEGDDETGVTTMLMDRGVDTGPTFLEERLAIGSEHTTGTLTEELAKLGGPLLERTLAELEAGRLTPTPQAEEGATYARKLEKDDGRLDWSLSASDLDRRVRGLSPWPGAFTTFRGDPLKVHRVRPADGELEAGRLRVEDGRVEVGTGSGLLQLIEVQAAGKARTEAAAWARGARPAPGELLGA